MAYLKIPDTMALFPWNEKRVNPLRHEVVAESSAWIARFDSFESDTKRKLVEEDFGLLASLVSFNASKDDKTSYEITQLNAVILDALHNPAKTRPSGEWPGGELARQFWERTIKVASQSAQRQFLRTFEEWLESVVEQARDRETDNKRDILSYMKLRRITVGLLPSLSVVGLEMELPDEALYHSTIQKMSEYCADLIAIDNDIVSYPKEKAAGDDQHNLVSLARDKFSLDDQSAINWTAGFHNSIVRELAHLLENRPRFEPSIDRLLNEYIDGMGNWVFSNYIWSFESRRYFGTRGMEVYRTKVIPMTLFHAEQSLSQEAVFSHRSSNHMLRTWVYYYYCILIAKYYGSS
ncbi:hypothetical protein NLG97_g390 [Lecanicillium saksenae]|uniref:Uncharacterized protein n=1 Tax=Lecanicillium saksenae TaxID=468837 RepID=A0ACC1R6L6_9HYPO|nr:hypothetical protein NLG97_g390 [Lecanicillium saksenae]